MTGAVRLAAIRDTTLDLEEVLIAVEGTGTGGVVSFVGRVRDHDNDKEVRRLEYTAHPTALDRLRDVCSDVARRHDADVAVVHRTGLLEIGAVAVIVAASSAHRGEAFEAARDLIDTLKATVPIWKLQSFADGTEEWVGTP